MKLIVNLNKDIARQQVVDNIPLLKDSINKAISGEKDKETNNSESISSAKLYSPHIIPALANTEDMIDSFVSEKLNDLYRDVCKNLEINPEGENKKTFEKSLGSDYFDKFKNEYNVELSDNTTREQAQTIWDALKEMPKNFLKGKLERIVLDERMGRSKRYYPNHGKYVESEKKIMINPTIFKIKERFNDGQGHSISKVTQVIIHELSHAIDDANGFSDSREWLNISGWKRIGESVKPPAGYKRLIIREEGTEPIISKWVFKKETEFPRWYAARNPKEDFAESFCFAITGLIGRFHGDTGKAKYEFIKKHVIDRQEFVKSEEDIIKGGFKNLAIEMEEENEEIVKAANIPPIPAAGGVDPRKEHDKKMVEKSIDEFEQDLIKADTQGSFALVKPKPAIAAPQASAPVIPGSQASKQKGKMMPGHKYIRREGEPGKYKYFYKDAENKIYSSDKPLHFEHAKPEYGVEHTGHETEKPWHNLLDKESWEKLKQAGNSQKLYDIDKERYQEYMKKESDVAKNKYSHAIWLYHDAGNGVNWYYLPHIDDIVGEKEMYVNPAATVPVFGGLHKNAPKFKDINTLLATFRHYNVSKEEFKDMFSEYKKKQDAFYSKNDKEKLTDKEHDTMDTKDPNYQEKLMFLDVIDTKDYRRYVYASPYTGKIFEVTSNEAAFPKEQGRYPIMHKDNKLMDYRLEGKIPMDVLYKKIHDEIALRYSGSPLYDEGVNAADYEKMVPKEQAEFEVKYDAMAYNPAKQFALAEKKMGIISTKDLKAKDVKADMSEGINVTLKVAIPKDGFGVMKAENPDLENLGGGTVEPKGQTRREIAAYELDKIFGFGIVPPTLKGKISKDMQKYYEENGLDVPLTGSDTSIQHFISIHDSDAGKIKDAKFDEAQALAIFDYITNNTDRHSKNYLVNSQNGKVYAIDNGLILGFQHFHNRNSFDALSGMHNPAGATYHIDKKMQSKMKHISMQGEEIKKVLLRSGFNKEQSKHYSNMITYRASVMAKIGKLPVEDPSEIAFYDSASPKVVEMAKWGRKNHNWDVQDFSRWHLGRRAGHIKPNDLYEDHAFGKLQ